MKQRFSLRCYIGLIFLTFPLLAAAGGYAEGYFTITDSSAATQALSNIQLICQPPTTADTPSYTCQDKIPKTVPSIPITQSGANFILPLSILESTVFPTAPKCPLMTMACSVQAQVGALPAAQIADFTFNTIGIWLNHDEGEFGTLQWGGIALSAVGPHPGMTAITLTPSVANGFNSDTVGVLYAYKNVSLDIKVSAPPLPPVDGTFTVTADAASKLTTAQLHCAIPTGTATGCTNPTDVTNIPLTVTGSSFAVNFSAIQKAIFPADSTCKIASMACSLQAADTLALLADFTITNLTTWPTDAAPQWGTNPLSGVAPQSGYSATASTSNPFTSGGATYYNGVELQVASTGPQISAGRITLANDVTTPSAVLACNENSFTAAVDPISKSEYFDLETLHGTGSPATTPMSLTGCALKDSATPSVTYALINTISNIAQQVGEDGTTQMWAADVAGFAMAPGDIFVSNTPSKPAQATDSYNQYTVAILPITAGSLNFGGDIVSQFGGKLALTCDGSALINLPATTMDLYALHGNTTSPDTAVNFAACTIETADASTTFATFALNGLQGTYATPSNPSPMWAASVTGIVPGNYAQFSVDTTPVTSSCDAQHPAMCNQSTINFHNVIPGSVDIVGVPTDTTLTCSDGVVRTGTPVSGGGISFNLATLHGAGDPSTDVSLSGCNLRAGIQYYGSLNLEAINATRSPTDQLTSKMWSAGIPVASLRRLVIDTAATKHCDGEGNCANWVLTSG